jgi:hypothetical protein
MVMNIENNLRLYLHFKDELDLVEVSAGTNDWDQRIAIMGIVQGKEQLIELLNEAGIDYFTVGGDAGTVPETLPLGYERTPQEMVKSLGEAFRTVDETKLKILNREQPTAEELATKKPIQVSALSSSTTVSEGLSHVQKWFKNRDQKN